MFPEKNFWGPGDAEFIDEDRENSVWVEKVCVSSTIVVDGSCVKSCLVNVE